ncbi:hypothetical protein [Protofrankia symbiont of Coriaria ruscifolia]|uniref:hypothetical protein n=1 Tax=Protofrankia symbiont of Coriaria ruscifolia TaxID=1306542 RepID=UPI001A93D849|nr:hypothetical protein [Protofrankia symbiont of Coriaria ruscifolia]
MKETVGHTVRHLVVAPVRVTWRKYRLTCPNAGCARESFVETTPLAVPGGRVSVAALETVGHLVGDWLVPVSRAAAALGVNWHTAHGGFVRVADQVGIVVTDLDEITEPGETAGEPPEAGLADVPGGGHSGEVCGGDVGGSGTNGQVGDLASAGGRSTGEPAVAAGGAARRVGARDR